LALAQDVFFVVLSMVTGVGAALYYAVSDEKELAGRIGLGAAIKADVFQRPP